MESLPRRHIQNMSEAATLEHHWGYADRAVPCTNDAGSCEYLDVVYHSHDLGIMYAGILWATLGVVLLLWALLRYSFNPVRGLDTAAIDDWDTSLPKKQGGLGRLVASVKSTVRRSLLLPEFIRSIFGRTTRLQVLILAVLVGYLTMWTFVGIVYKTWITPVTKSTLYNTRTSLGPFADRVGVLAYALMPFAIMLSSRESILSLVTGIPYQHFNFLHRWLGYIIFAQSVLHTIGWTVIETRLYQPQPKVAREWIVQRYMIWGIVAQIFVTFIFVSSMPPVVRLTGYEFFRKAHYVVAILFIGACWGHWSALSCFMIASLVVWFLDRGVRLVRTGLLHYNFLSDGSMGFRSANAQVTHFPDDRNGDVVRLDFEHPHGAWTVGQHFYLCFPELSIWQSHPFTPTSLPRPGGSQRHAYIIRSKRGQTSDLAKLAASKTNEPIQMRGKGDSGTDMPSPTAVSTSVILTGPYGEDTASALNRNTNILCIAGGTGITYVLPVLLDIAARPAAQSDRKIELIWAMRVEDDINWVRPELETLEKSATRLNLTIRTFITRECCTDTPPAPQAVDLPNNTPITLEKPHLQSTVHQTPSSSSSTSSQSIDDNDNDHHRSRPNLHALTTTFLDRTINGPTTVFASGPPGMITDARRVVAQCNDGWKVWRGREKYDVSLFGDDRLEW